MDKKPPLTNEEINLIYYAMQIAQCFEQIGYSFSAAGEEAIKLINEEHRTGKRISVQEWDGDPE